MMWSTSMMVGVLALAVVSLIANLILSALLLWAGRRYMEAAALHGELTTVRNNLSTLRKDHNNLDEIFESYRKRDAVRVSNAVQRRKKAEQQEENEQPPDSVEFKSGDDVVRYWKARNGGQ